ncbi:MAG: type IV pilus secretin PilQ [Desulfobacteraceae bacterium]|nr:type IV pilus secretin PilQ [Desulfobacteraceae bacterium]
MILNRFKKRKLAGFGLIIFALLLMAGCVKKDVKTGDDFNQWKIKAEKLKGYSPVEEMNTGTAAPAVPENFEGRGPEPDGKVPKRPVIEEEIPPPRSLPVVKVSMEMYDVPVDVVIRTLAKAANVNIIISKNVTGNTDMNIDGVPWDQAFESVLKTFGYSYEWIGDIIRVISIEDINNNVGLMEARQSMELKKREYDLTMLAMKSKAEELEPLKTRIIPIRYIGNEDLEPLRDNLWNMIRKSGGAMGAAGGDGAESAPDESPARGGIMIDRHTHSLMVQGTSADIERVVKIIKELDKPVLQVLIEAQIVEANKDTARELGVQWGGLGREHGNGRSNWVGGPMGTPDTGLLTSEAEGTYGDPEYVPKGTPVMHLPPIGNAINLASEKVLKGQGMNLGMMFEEPGKYMLTLQLQALQSQGKLNILSNPSITTLDNQKAVIESGKEVPFQTIEDDEVKIEFKKAVIKLDVTPHIINDKILKLEIITSKDELDWSHMVAGNPTIITKNAETGVVLFDGQTTVIGGLNKSMKTDGGSGVPLLKDVPGLGYFFKSSSKTNAMEDLLIFITPHILDSKNFQDVKQQRAAAQESKDRQPDTK